MTWLFFYHAVAEELLKVREGVQGRQSGQRTLEAKEIIDVMASDARDETPAQSISHTPKQDWWRRAAHAQPWQLQIRQIESSHGVRIRFFLKHHLLREGSCTQAKGDW